MLKIKLEYDLPVYDPDKHDPDKTFAFLTYRGVNYAKWVRLRSRGKQNVGFIQRSFLKNYRPSPTFNIGS